jgi:hypothetical protein
MNSNADCASKTPQILVPINRVDIQTLEVEAIYCICSKK